VPPAWDEQPRAAPSATRSHWPVGRETSIWPRLPRCVDVPYQRLTRGGAHCSTRALGANQGRRSGVHLRCVDGRHWGDGRRVGASARWRLETRGGISTKGETFENDEVTHLCEQVLKSVRLIGPANVQGFVDGDGGVVIHEVNPRFSGGLPLSLHAGADLVEEYLRAIMGVPVRPKG